MEPSTQSFKRVTRAIIINDEGKVLLGKRMRNGEVGKFALIGGTPDGDETDQEAVIREVKEETELDFDPVLYKKMEDKLSGESEPWHVSFFAGKIKGTLQFKPDEISEIIWVSPQDLETVDIGFNHKEILREFFIKQN